MNTPNPTNTAALNIINRYRRMLTTQQFKTMRGQILAGNAEGALRGLKKTLERNARAHEHQTRQSPGRRNG